MMALSGVRSSWVRVARKRERVELASSASSLAARSYTSARLRSSTSM